MTKGARQKQKDERIQEIALAVKNCVVAMRPTMSVAAQAYSALYRDVLISIFSQQNEAHANEISGIIENRLAESFGLILADVNGLIKPELKPDTFTPPMERQTAYH